MAKSSGYSGLAKLLHWTIVVLLFMQFSIALTMPEIHRDTVPDRMINLHFSFGLLILLVAIVRLRLARGARRADAA